MKYSKKALFITLFGGLVQAAPLPATLSSSSSISSLVAPTPSASFAGALPTAATSQIPPASMPIAAPDFMPTPTPAPGALPQTQSSSDSSTGVHYFWGLPPLLQSFQFPDTMTAMGVNGTLSVPFPPPAASASASMPMPMSMSRRKRSLRRYSSHP